MGMALPFKHHLFVCTNERPPGHKRGSCAEKGSEEIRARFKAELDARGLKGAVRANAAGCLDQCEQGVTCVVYGTANTEGGVWYGHVKLEDVPEVVQSHLVEGKPVERLLLKRPGPVAPSETATGSAPAKQN
jgi:(2Fe-2S) ferredoxin